MSTSTAGVLSARRAQITFVIAWAFCLVFYVVQYALRSSPGVMILELTAAFGLSAVGVSPLIGLGVCRSFATMQQRCPAGENIQAWLGLAQVGKCRAAWEALIRDNPMPAPVRAQAVARRPI